MPTTPYNRAGPGQPITAPKPKAPVAAYDEWGTPYDAQGNSLADPPMSWGETALRGLAAPVNFGIGIAGALSPYDATEGGDGWRVPPAIQEPYDAWQRLGEGSGIGTDEQGNWHWNIPSPDDSQNRRDAATVGLTFYGGNALSHAVKPAAPAGSLGMFAGRRSETLAQRFPDFGNVPSYSGFKRTIEGDGLNLEAQTKGTGERAYFMRPDGSDGPVGFVNVSEYPIGLEVNSVGVVPEARGNGYANTAYDMIEADTGRTIKPSGFLTSEGKALWDKRQPGATDYHRTIPGEPQDYWYSPKRLTQMQERSRAEGTNFADKLQGVLDTIPPEARTPEYLSTIFSDTGKPSIFGSAIASATDRRPIRAFTGTRFGSEPLNRYPVYDAMASAGDAKKTLWASSDSEVASSYATDIGSDLYWNEIYPAQTGHVPPPRAGAVFPLLMDFKNPLEIDAGGATFNNVPFNGMRSSADEVAWLAREMGHDGVIFKYLQDHMTDQNYKPSTVYAAVKPNTVRSSMTGETLFSDTGKPSIFGSAIASQQSSPMRLWHSTPAKFDKFDDRFTDEVGFHFGSKSQAHNRAYIMSGGNPWEYFTKWRDIPVDVEMKNPLRISQDPGSFMPTKLAQQLVKDGVAPHDLIARVQDAQLGPNGSPEAAKAVVKDFLISKGYDGISYPNVYEGVGDSSFMALGTGNVKDARTGATLYSDTGRPSLFGSAIAGELGQKGIIAYHGSPHDFDKFDLSKIGTGEGAQAYGHGLYFAENEGVAKSYRNQLGKSQLDGLPEDEIDDVRDGLRWITSGRNGRVSSNAKLWVDDAKSQLEAEGIVNPTDRQIAERLDEQLRPNGHMYQVRINADPNDFLNFDAPIGSQSENVQNILNSLGVSDPSLTGANAMTKLGTTNNWRTRLSGPSERLKQAGIPGIRYLDQMSRSAGDGTSNYVVFNADIIDILRKYGLIPPLVGASGSGLSLYGMNSLSQPQDQ